MALRSRISPRFFVNELASAMSEDWDTSSKFVRYQLAKKVSTGDTHSVPNTAKATLSNW